MFHKRKFCLWKPCAVKVPASVGKNWRTRLQKEREMAGRHLYSIGNPRSKSPALLLLLSLFILFFFFFFFSSSPFLLPQNPNSIPSRTPPEYSFVASLEHFLLTSNPPLRSPGVPDDTVVTVAQEGSVAKLDESIWRREREKLLREDSLYPALAFSPLRVYVYEMPSKFTFDLLWLFRNTYKETSNLTSNGSPVHRLIEQVRMALLVFFSHRFVTWCPCFFFFLL